MNEALATVGSEGGAQLYRIGIQLALLGAVALVFGALRLLVAERTRRRFVLAAGLVLFAAGSVLQTFEHLGALQLDYYPGWKADLEETFLHVDPELEFSEEDLEVSFGEPDWWEGIAWWGQRIARVAGLTLAITGFVLEGRTILLQPAGRKRKRVLR